MISMQVLDSFKLAQNLGIIASSWDLSLIHRQRLDSDVFFTSSEK